MTDWKTVAMPSDERTPPQAKMPQAEAAEIWKRLDALEERVRELEQMVIDIVYLHLLREGCDPGWAAGRITASAPADPDGNRTDEVP